MPRLRKVDVETLMAAIDSPLLIDALRTALSHAMDVEPFDDDWPALIRLAGQRAGWTDDRVTLLVGRDNTALVQLATELNELRGIG